VRHGGLLVSVPPPYERRDHVRLQRPRPEERDGRYDVLELSLLQPGGQVALPGTLELEQAYRAGRADELVDRGVVLGQLPRRDLNARALADTAHCLGDGRMHLEPQDIHLDQA